MWKPCCCAFFLFHFALLPQVLFITTANILDTIQKPLLDRMEIIRLSGYVLQEKMSIARKYLIPAARKDSAIADEQVTIEDSAIEALCQSYCREAGVRNLQKHVEKIFRKCAYKVCACVCFCVRICVCACVFP